MKTLISIFSLLVIVHSQISAQDCQACKPRTIILYDNYVNVPRPQDDAGIYRYWDFFYIAAGVKDYVIKTDPTCDCFSTFDGAFFTTKGAVQTNIKWGIEHANTPPPGEAGGYADYLLYGVVSGDVSQTVTLNLETGKTRELVQSNTVSLPLGFDPFATGGFLAASIGPLYTTILDFEKQKRDQGEPYAIQPKITFTPERTSLNSGESTVIDILFKDCDDVSLKARVLTLTVTGGTLKSDKVITDDNGEALVEFVAGSQTTLAKVTSIYPFEKATGYHDVADVDPAFIQINKPDNTWYINAVFNVQNTNTESQTASSMSIKSNSSDQTHILFGAWVKNMSPLKGHFSVDPKNQLIDLDAKKAISSYSHTHVEAPGAFTDEQDTFVANSSDNAVSAPHLEAMVSARDFNFGLQKISADQTGHGMNVLVNSDPINGTTTTIDNITPDPTDLLGLSLSGETRDTTYTIYESESSGTGITTTKTTMVEQRCSWDSTYCELSYNQRYTEVSQGLLGELAYETHWIQQYNVVVFVLSPDRPTAVSDRQNPIPTVYSLAQNYPNPFNSTTVIRYQVPAFSGQLPVVSVRVYDSLGREVAILVDETKTPGVYEAVFDGGKLTSGVYFYRMQAASFTATKKFLLLR
jgi:hypothetical protein